jgi:hypothetical protein
MMFNPNNNSGKGKRRLGLTLRASEITSTPLSANAIIAGKPKIIMRWMSVASNVCKKQRKRNGANLTNKLTFRFIEKKGSITIAPNVPIK